METKINIKEYLDELLFFHDKQMLHLVELLKNIQNINIGNNFFAANQIIKNYVAQLNSEQKLCSDKIARLVISIRDKIKLIRIELDGSSKSNAAQILSMVPEDTQFNVMKIRKSITKLALELLKDDSYVESNKYITTITSELYYISESDKMLVDVTKSLALFDPIITFVNDTMAQFDYRFKNFVQVYNDFDLQCYISFELKNSSDDQYFYVPKPSNHLVAIINLTRRIKEEVLFVSFEVTKYLTEYFADGEKINITNIVNFYSKKYPDFINYDMLLERLIFE